MRKIYVLGDSISIHYGPYLKAFCEGVFEYDRKRGIDQALDDLDNPVGANGGDSNQVLEYLNEKNSRGMNYDILLLNCGLHDIRRNIDTGKLQTEPEAYKSNLKGIIGTALKMSNKVIWVESTPVVDEIHNSISKSMYRYNRDLLQYNQIADSIMSNKGIELIGLYEFTKSMGPMAYYDHIHFKPEAREKQAKFIYGHLETICLK